MIRRKLEPFGEHASEWAGDLAQFLGIKIPEAVDRMDKAARAYGYFNVLEAIREAIGTPNVKSPAGLFGSILSRLLNDHGKRDAMPKPKVETGKTAIRQLSMAERCFPVC